MVNTITAHIGVVPHTLRNGNRARYNTRRHLCLDANLAAIIEHPNDVAIFYPTRLRIHRIHPCDMLRRRLNDLVVGIGGMRVRLVMKTGDEQRYSSVRLT